MKILRSKIEKALAAMLTGLMLFMALPINVAGATTADHLVINEIQTAGISASDEFVELYNPTDASVSINGWELHYRSATGNTWSVINGFGSQTLAAHSYFVIAGTGFAGSKDATLGGSGLAAAGGHVRLVSPTGEVDRVGWGATAIFPENVPAVAPAASKSISRTNGVDTNNNSMDFTEGIPTPGTGTTEVPAPELTEVTKIPAYTNNPSPAYSFNSSQAGTVNYLGSCSGKGDLTEVITGKNTVVFGPLTDGEYSNCKISVTNASLKTTDLTVPGFTVDTVAPVLKATRPVAQLTEEQPVVSDPGVYVTDQNKAATVTTNWKVKGLNEKGEQEYDVAYVATDLAGNASTPLTTKVTLTKEPANVDVTGETALGMTLVKDATDPLVIERTTVYEDKGASVSWLGSYLHVWMGGNFDLTKVSPIDKPYELTYNAAQANDYLNLSANIIIPVTRKIQVVDTKAPGAITGFFLATGDAFVDLHWVNPTDADFDGVNIYRSISAGVLGDKLARTSKSSVSYEDNQVVNGITYYYTLKPVDNASPANEGEATIQIGATPTAPQIVSSDTNFGYYDSDSSMETTAKEEIKANTDVGTTDNKENKNLPAFGVALLVILALVGIYLLYLQNPTWFMFWKRRKKDKK